MGCDIHAHIEVKIKGRWHYYGEAQIRQNYELFEKMAGVRGHADQAIAPPRRLPGNVAFMTRFKRDHDKGHSHSWLCLDEMRRLVQWVQYHKMPVWGNWNDKNSDLVPPFGIYVFGDHFDSFKRFPQDCPKGLQDIRLVFWFDS